MTFDDFVMNNWSFLSSNAFEHSERTDSLMSVLGLAPERPIDLRAEVPERSGKTLITTVLWPTWLWLQNPQLNILIVVSRMAMQARARQDFVRLANKAGFPPQKDADGIYTNHLGGSRIVRPITSLLGYRCDVLIADDLLSVVNGHPEKQQLVSAYHGHARVKLSPRGSSVLIESSPGVMQFMREEEQQRHRRARRR